VDRDASWLEVSIQVTKEQAEAVAEILGRFTPEGVVIERLAKDSISEEQSFESTVRVFGYLFDDANLEDKKKRLEEALFYLSRIQSLSRPQYKRIHDKNWMSAWKDQYKPLQIGNRLAILPAWAKNPYSERIPIRINPGMAFGTGTHPTTQLCLELMETRVLPGLDVIDVGCGSGILSIAAVLLGANHAYGADVSPAAVKSSLENAAINKTESSLTFIQGSVDEISLGAFDIIEAPLVIVNILATIIMRLFDENLASLAAPGGVLILSGILEPQSEQVLQKAQQFGLRLLEKREIEDWVALCLLKQQEN